MDEQTKQQEEKIIDAIARALILIAKAIASKNENENGVQ